MFFLLGKVVRAWAYIARAHSYASWAVQLSASSTHWSILSSSSTPMPITVRLRGRGGEGRGEGRGGEGRGGEGRGGEGRGDMNYCISLLPILLVAGSHDSLGRVDRPRLLTLFRILDPQLSVYLYHVGLERGDSWGGREGGREGVGKGRQNCRFT